MNKSAQGFMLLIIFALIAACFSDAFAVVGDVTLTGLPPNTTLSLTNEETKETVEQKTDDRGFVIIPLTGKNWQSGRHSVTCQIDGKLVSSRIFLRNGVNRVDLTTLTYLARPLDPAKRQRVDEALKKSSATLKADPKNSQALLTQGAALNRLGRHGEALAQLARAVKMGSTHPALAFETGWSLMRLGMYPEAIAQLEKYEKMKPGLGQTSEFIGRSHLFLNELDKADAKFNEALKRDPKLTSTVRFHQAVLETARKNPEAASKHIDALLKEAPNSPTAQAFKNALLQPPGAKDYRLSDPIKIQLPPTTAADVAAGVAKGVVGGLLGGLFGGGRRDEPEGPNLVAKPKLPETTLTSKDSKTKINLSGAIEDGKPYVVMGVNESPGNGAPHLILLQDKNCNVLQPKETSVTGIWEQWGGWKLTVSWTKSYYENGRLVKQEKGGWSTPWNVFRTQVKDPGEIPGIWKDFGGKAFEGIRGVVSSFEPPPEIPFNPADWNLIAHATTDAGNNQIVTAPFVTGLGTDKDNNLTFQQRDRTVCESAPPSAPLLANTTTFPWNVGPFGLQIAQQGDRTITRDAMLWAPIDQYGSSSQYDFQYNPRFTVDLRYRFPFTPDQPRTNEPSSGGSVAGPKIEMRPGGTSVVTYPDGTKFEYDPMTGLTQILEDGTKIITIYRGDGGMRVVFPDGSSVEVGKDGSINFNDPPQPTQQAEGPPPAEPDVPGLEDSDNALPVDQVM